MALAPGFLLAAVLAALAYVVSGKIGLRLASVNPSATAVWPPSGIALATLLLLGTRAWPAVFAAAFVVNVTTTGIVATSLGIAGGNTLEALLGAYLVNRWAGGRDAFAHPRDVFKFAALAGLLSQAVGATVGVTTLLVGGLATLRDFGPIWLTWWGGDASGVLVVAPPLILWASSWRLDYGRHRALENVLRVLLTVIVGALVLGGLPAPVFGRAPISFVCVPLVVWAAFRCGPRETATAVLLLSLFAVVGAHRGVGSFPGATENESLLLIKAFMGVLSMTALPLAAVVREQQRDREALRIARDELAEAQRVAGVGSWSWDRTADAITWTDETARIHGCTPADFRGTYEGFSTTIHPEEREAFREAIAHAVRTGEPIARDYRILRPDGAVRWVHGRGKVIAGPDGAPSRMVGTCQDITASREAAQRLAASLHEKELLLREVHHRVKNNLQIIASLLSLQAARGGRELREALAESEGRLRAMSLVHESLMRAEEVSRVDAAAYVRGLVTKVADSFAQTRAAIALRLQVADLRLDPTDAAHYGMILNELVTNSYKHAFAGRAAGEVVVDLHTGADGSTVLVVGDDGVGFGAAPDLHDATSLGLQLVTLIVQDLRGTIERVESPASPGPRAPSDPEEGRPRGPGTAFRITVPARARTWSPPRAA